MNLEVNVRSRNVDGNEIWEGTANIPGLRATKIVRRADNTTAFSSRSALLTSARNVARTLGFDGVVEPTAKAAKRSTRAKTQS